MALSPSSVSSLNVQREIEIAINQSYNNKFRIVPVLYKKCSIPDVLKDKIYKDFTDHDKFDDSLLKLVEALKVKKRRKLSLKAVISFMAAMIAIIGYDYWASCYASADVRAFAVRPRKKTK